ncbi:MAG: hypothetical protein E7618_05145 [Ruminococcaceae bacterium]|nr:hypothetical protein [Oscillospiraceae bacterium]
MSDSVHAYTYAVVRKSEGGYRLRRYLAIALYILCPLLLLFLLLYVIGPAAFIWFVPLCPTVLMIVVRLTYSRNFHIEYEYSIGHGTLTVTEIRGKTNRKVLLACPIAAFTTIAPYRYTPEDLRRRQADGRVIMAVSSLTSPDLYYAVTADSANPTVKVVLFFEATSKMLRLLQFHNPNTVVSSVRF